MTSPIGNECLQFSEADLSKVAARARAMCDEVDNLAEKRHFRRAVQKALNGAALYETIGDTPNRSRMFGKAGDVCVTANHHRAAAFYYWKALRTLRDEDLTYKAWVWGNLARVYRHLWNFTSAEKYNRVHLKISMQQNNMIQTGYAHLGIGLNHYYQQNWDLAMEHTQKALVIFSSLGERRLEFTANLNMACVYNARGQAEEARSILNRILVPGNLSQNPSANCLAYEELARVYLNTGDYAEFKQAREKTAEWALVSKSLVEMGRVFMLDAEWCWFQGQRKKAVQSARKAIIVFRNHGAVGPLHTAERKLFGWLKGEMYSNEGATKTRDCSVSGGDHFEHDGCPSVGGSIGSTHNPAVR